jgi:thiol-disulfide isomerase/thioredoxin
MMNNHGSAFSKSFLTNRNATTGTSKAAAMVSRNAHGGSDDINELKQDVQNLKKQVDDISSQLGIFGQHLASVKPNVVHAKDFDSIKFASWVEQVLEKPGTVIVVGATWCPHCKSQMEELNKLPAGTLSYVVYVDGDNKVAAILKGMGHEIVGLPTTFKTTGGGKMEQMCLGYTPASELIKKL